MTGEDPNDMADKPQANNPAGNGTDAAGGPELSEETISDLDTRNADPAGGQVPPTSRGCFIVEPDGE